MFNLFETEQEPTKAPKLIKGNWVLIQFIPNPNTSEVFNIGVIFKPHRKPFSYRIIKTALNFETMYGKDGANNFSFLIAVLNEYLETNNHLKLSDLNIPSSQIKISASRIAQGQSEIFILSSLYKNLVPLSWNEESNEDNQISSNISVATSKLRRSIYKKIKKSNPEFAKEIYHTEPIYIEIENKKFSLDLPFYNTQSKLFSNQVITFGSVVSMRQKSKIHRDHDLLKANKDLSIAKSYFKDNSNGFLLLLNSGDVLNETEAQSIDREIDECIWLLKKNGIFAESFNSEFEISNKVLQLAA